VRHSVALIADLLFPLLLFVLLPFAFLLLRMTRGKGCISLLFLKLLFRVPSRGVSRLLRDTVPPPTVAA
jgi:hypothetical protein